jgi:hypothetical protein
MSSPAASTPARSMAMRAAAAAMSAAVYFGGTGRTPFAMIGTVAFVALGGLGFELTRRRSL